MSNHTPGPWFAYSLQGSASTVPTPIAFVNGPSVVVAGDGKTQGFKPDDAHLIAAAPDLLAAIRKMLPENNRDDQHLRPTFAICEEARAAIAKAEGRS